MFFIQFDLMGWSNFNFFLQSGFTTKQNGNNNHVYKQRKQKFAARVPEKTAGFFRQETCAVLRFSTFSKIS